MNMRIVLAASVAAAAIAMPSAAFAQSTGSTDFENSGDIIVTGQASQDVVGVQQPDSAKSKAVLTQEFIAHQNPGQTVLDTINQIPGVSFQNNDAYGSSGGTLSIRGFSSDRISLTFDGVPLNDSGNYAIYSNQQLDPELIEQVNVNMGTTDVDSPTASAVGGTVNYRTRKPSEDFGMYLSGSAGEFEFMRIFGMVDTGAIGPWGTRAFVSASTATNNNPFNNYGRVNKQQYNARIYQPLAGDDFISVAVNYNENRNNFFGSLPLRTDAGRVVGSAASNRFPTNNNERTYNINYPCLNTVVPVAGTVQAASTCGTEFDRRYNPSNTGNIRGASRFSLSDNLVLTIDPSFQYVKANGGGTVTAREGLRDINPTSAVTNAPGYLGGTPYFGRDLNGDGDLLDSVTMMAPSQTQTRRVGVISSLRYDINESNTVRLNYTYDRARHRQTGEVGALELNGEPIDVFPVNAGLADISGSILQKRDRLSRAILHQVSAEYRGEFMDERLVVNLGVRAPFFRRELQNNCFTSSASGFVECFGSNALMLSTYAGLNPTAALPQNRVFNYNKVLPNIGFTFDVTSNVSVYGSFAQGLSVPGTDSLYNAFFFPVATARARPNPETTDSFDGGIRFRSGNIQAMVAGWYTQYHNRLASAYDPELDQNVYRNLGSVRKYGIDGSIAFQPVPELALYLFGSWNKSKIADNVATGEVTTLGVTTTIFAPTAGQRESGSPTYSFGGTVRGILGPLDIGLTGKRTGPRYIFDTNLPVFGGTTAVPTTLYGAQAPAYWLVNMDARLNLGFLGLNDRTHFQLNVYNLFDKFYVGGFGGGLNQSINTTTGAYGSPPFVQIGAPRTISGTVVVAF